MKKVGWGSKIIWGNDFCKYKILTTKICIAQAQNTLSTQGREVKTFKT